jgi:DNA mismatch repair protein MutS
LTQEGEITARQDAVGYLCDHGDVRARVRRALGRMADVERIAGRVALSRTHPRDLAGLGATLDLLPKLADHLTESHLKYLTDLANDLTGLNELAALLTTAIKDDPPLGLREGGFIE